MSSSGWNRPSANQPKRKGGTKVPSMWKGVVAGLAVAVPLVALLVWMLPGGDELPAQSSPHKAPIAPAMAEDLRTKHKAQDTSPAPREKSAAAVAREYSNQVKQFVKKSTGTNNVTWIVPPLAPDDPDRALHTRVTQELGSLLSVEPGEQMPPFPYSFLIEDDMRARGEDVSDVDNGNKGFLESLEKFKIVAKETDDAHRLEHKKRLLEAQGELLAGMKEGVSVNDSIRAAYEFRKNAYEVRSTIIKTLTEIASEEGTDQAKVVEEIHDMNKRLAEEGIKAIPIESVLPDYEEPDEEN